MAREAAVLGTPSFSLYAGEVLAVDEFLAGQRRLVFLRTAADLESVVPRRKSPTVGLLTGSIDLARLVAATMIGTSYN